MSLISTDSLSPRGKTGVFFVHLAKHVKIIGQQKKNMSPISTHMLEERRLFFVSI
jgi:hypothetical protein